MNDRPGRATVFALMIMVPAVSFGQEKTPRLPAPVPEAGPSSPESPRVVEASGRQVLIELYTSQGCNYCPTAERLLQEMVVRGYGPEKAVTLCFHVDYFNEPWPDPFSSKLYSGRQWAYHQAFKRRDKQAPDLFFTPMIMVDGRYPMSGYHSEGADRVWPLLKARLDRSLKTRRGSSLTLVLKPIPDHPGQQSLTVRALPKTSRLSGRELLVGVAITEGPLSTKVSSGENSGATLTENHVVRHLQADELTLRQGEPAEATFTLELGDGWEPAQCEIVAFLQEEATGTIHQVATMPWEDRSAPGP